MSPQERAALRASVAGIKGYGTVDAQRVELTPTKTSAPDSGNFFSNIGNSIGGIGKSIVDFGRDTIRDNSISKLPQVWKSIQDTGFNMGPVNIQGKNSVVSAQLAKRSSDALKKLQAGSIKKSEFDKEMKDINSAFDELSKKSDESAARLKDASQYSKQFAANANIGTLALTGLESIAGKTVASAAGKEAIQGAFSNGLKGVGKGIASEIGIPGVGLTERTAVNAGGNLLTGAAKFVGRAGMNLLDTSNFTAPGSFSAGNTAINATSLIPGGPLNVITKAGSAVGKVAKGLTYDTHGLFDLVKLKNGETVNTAFKSLKSADPSTASKLEKTLKQVQDYNLRATGGDKKAAADKLTEYIGTKNLNNISLEDFVKEQKRFIEADRSISRIPSRLKEGEAIVDASGNVVEADKLKQLGAVKSSTSEVGAALKALQKSEMSVGMDAGLAKFRLDYPGFFQNKQNERILNDIAQKGLVGEEAARYARGKLRATQELMILGKDGTMKPITMPGGYYMGIRKGEKFANAADTAALEAGKKAPLGAVGRTLENAGLSTQEASSQAGVYKRIKSTFAEKVDSIEGFRGEMSADTAFRKLEDASSKPGVTDIRQLSWKEVQTALGTNDKDSKAILQAVKDSFLAQPLKDRGLAGKIMDINTAKNPLAAPYSRIQGKYRYEQNPSFRLQENIETRLGTKLATGASPQLGRDYTDTINVLKNEGVLSAGYANEGAGEGVGKIAAKLSKDQERTLASGFEALSSGTGQNVRQFVTDPKNKDLVDNMRTIVQYPEKGLTSSNFMKALNLAVFPARYNLKVTQFAVKALAKEPGIRQIAVINGINKFNNFLDSDAGTKWKSDNSELLGILQYYTPVGSIDYVRRALTGKIRNPRDLGSIGGLPFGLISTVLQGQGVYKGDSPYVDPKTGEIVPDKIPQDAKARIEQALTDIVGTMFTFPGRIINAPSKNSISKKIVETGTFGAFSGGKYDSVERGKLTPEQENTQRVLRGSSASSLKVPTSKPISVPQIKKSQPVAIPQKQLKLSQGRKVKPKFLAKPF